jgi:DNA-binding transcriptional MerR regulator
MEKNENMLSIGDVARFLKIPTHTIRYWEKEFKDFLSPSRTIGHQRRYSDEDVKKIRDIMRLLKHEKYSIAGARKILELKHKRNPNPAYKSNDVPEEVAQRILEMIKEQLNVNEAKSIVA